LTYFNEISSRRKTPEFLRSYTWDYIRHVSFLINITFIENKLQ